MDVKEPFTYRGNKRREISFPLGGIGTGCIGLAGDGRLVDWEIFNRPNKGSINGFSHFAVKVENLDGQLRDARVLQGDLGPPYSGSFSASAGGNFGFGVPRQFLAGLPHFRETVFHGQFPFARLEYLDEQFPGQVQLLAFNPFIPLNETDSGLPAAFFEFEITNSTPQALRYMLAGTLNNPLEANNLNSSGAEGPLCWLSLRSDGLQDVASGYGNLAIGTDSPGASVQEYWFRGAWFDALEIFWRDFTSPGKIKPRSYPVEQAGKENPGTLAVQVELKPGQVERVRFLIAWHFPNCENYWDSDYVKLCHKKGLPTTWKNYYARRFSDSVDVMKYGFHHWDRLQVETWMFKEALFSSSLPPVALEAISANLSILKSPTVLRLEDGTFYGFEGCWSTRGCCEGSCTHVWNYNQALPFLFPRLERSMREFDYRYNLRPDGGMRFRIPLPPLPAADYFPFRACADGQFGGVLKTYREWKISGDTDWLSNLWPRVQQSVEFAWAKTNLDQWDPEKTGVLRGRMHHTLDMELFGPDAWLTGFYLAALKAAGEMAEATGELAAACEYYEIFHRGYHWLEEHLFNGEYFQQDIDLTDRKIVEPFDAQNYWSDETGEIKYQIGEGCEIDQVLAQWHANLYGLGVIYDPDQLKSALRAIYRYNFKAMREHFNPHRVYSLNDERGVLMCAWPEGKVRPAIPTPYSYETMTGFEYAVATLMIQNGMVDEGVEIVTAIRERYDGEKRNPWNEIECGSNYARALASYALLNAFSGFEFDGVARRIGFRPVPIAGETFRCFWSLDSGWGLVEITPKEMMLRVLLGSLEVNEIGMPDEAGVKAIHLGGEVVGFTQEGRDLKLATTTKLQPGVDINIKREKINHKAHQEY